MKKLLAYAAIILFFGNIDLWMYKQLQVTKPVPQAPQVQQYSAVPPREEPTYPETPTIATVIPEYLPYNKVVEQLDTWHKEAPKLTERGTYGKSSQKKDLHYIRVTNLDGKPKKKVLITGCIHGNEPLATTVVMGYIGTLLANYGKDQEVTDLLNTRDIYFVPVVSPDSFPNSRIVDGVDPNRDFPGPSKPNHQSVPPVKALQDLFSKHQFNAVISGHTFGRVLLTPYGDRTEVCPNAPDYSRIIGWMSSLCNYRVQRACEMYSRPIYGTEVDWYYRHGAFAIVMEFGTHQRIPTKDDIRSEFDRTYKGFLYFLKEAPQIKINNAK